MRSAKSIGNVENKLESNSDGRGAKSLLPYSKEDIKKAGKYMAMKPGDKVIDIDGDEYILSTVQVLMVQWLFLFHRNREGGSRWDKYRGFIL